MTNRYPNERGTRVKQPTLEGAESMDSGSPEVWRLTDLPAVGNVRARQLDVPESIPALGYGSHQFFRYYGKFPSIVGREIVREFRPERGAVLDSYAGSGTTLVEAQITGLQSGGVDINPLAVLASNVKTAYLDPEILASALAEFMADLPADPGWRPSKPASWCGKWFTPETATSLGRLRARVQQFAEHPGSDFLALTFLAIIRRVSNAFDGEVRPHINRDKRPRDVFKAFKDKAQENLAGLGDLNTRRPRGITSLSILGDNRDAAVYDSAMRGQPAGLVVAHPPYLNSFNYLGAFSLELAWSEGIQAVWGNEGWNLKRIQALEQKAWPATDPNITSGYYDALMQTMKASCAVATSGCMLAVVVGDATIRGVLEPVHLKVWEALKGDGLEQVEIWFRTTHYGIGKYAYASRADYHGEAEKKDAILFLRVP